MLKEFYASLDTPEEIGKDIVIPKYSGEALYLSERGELFCYMGICGREKSEVHFKGRPYYLPGHHTQNCEKQILGFFRIKNGCILLSGFVDHEFYNETKYKQLSDYFVRMPVAKSCYFGVDSASDMREMQNDEITEELTRACFGLTYHELEHLVGVYAECFGICSDYVQYPRITRSLRNDNFCELTGIWIPAKFPYIAFSESIYSFSHVSLYGFYRYIGLMLSMGPANMVSELFQQKVLSKEIINRTKQIDDYFPFEIKVTREYVIPDMYVK